MCVTDKDLSYACYKSSRVAFDTRHSGDSCKLTSLHILCSLTAVYLPLTDRCFSSVPLFSQLKFEQNNSYGQVCSFTWVYVIIQASRCYQLLRVYICFRITPGIWWNVPLRQVYKKKQQQSSLGRPLY